MRIGIDIDDTITDTRAIVREIKRREYPEYNPNELLPKEIFQDFIVRFDDEIHRRVTLKEGAIEALNELKTLGHEIVILTARGEYSKNSYQDTKDYFAKNRIPYDKMVFDCKNKGHIASSLGIELMIDDKESICRQMEEYKIPFIKMKKDGEISIYPEFDSWLKIIEYIKKGE